MKSIVAYFSAEWGKTKSIAEALAKKTGADLFEIVPKDPYTEADLRYMNPLARCNREKIGRKDVPVADRVHGWDSYDIVYLGFPIWYYGAPNVVNTFCKDYDWSGKKVYIFATSGGSGIGKTKEKLQAYLNGAEIIDSKRVANISELESRV
jgi:flavodoxin